MSTLRRLLIASGTALSLCVAVAAQGSGVWLDVPFIKQPKNGCGAASIAMIMQYWQKQSGGNQHEDSDPADIQRTLSSEAHGIYASDMEHYFHEHGFRTYTFRGQWNDLKQHLEKGRPLIVALKPMPSETALHYVVVAGLDWQQNVVLVNDPAQRKLLKVDRTNFVAEWNAVDDWTLLALPEPSK